MRARPRAARPALSETPGWGWVEWTILAQILLPGLMFVPGFFAARTPLRVASYASALVAWFFCARQASARRAAAADTFPARPWLVVSSVWLGFSLFHPNNNSMTSALAQVMLYIAILAPAFWAALVVRSSRQVPRMLAVLFLCNALSTVVGIAQIYRPATFNPPSILGSDDPYFDRLEIDMADGRRVLRPCGLTDTPGAACGAGMVTALLGLCWALRPIAAWKRLGSLVLAFLGVAVIYFSHVRVSLVMLAICLAALTALLVLQRRYREAALLSAGGASIIVGALGWVVATAGEGVRERFLTLFAANPAQVYNSNRGGMVWEAFGKVLWEYPLGYGLGWWGMINVYFGRKDIATPVWVEVMWPAWIFDGGFPLLIAYTGAVVVALIDSARIALTSRDRDLAFWAAVIFASNLGIVATCFSFITFLTPFGVQF